MLWGVTVISGLNQVNIVVSRIIRMQVEFMIFVHESLFHYLICVQRWSWQIFFTRVGACLPAGLGREGGKGGGSSIDVKKWCNKTRGAMSEKHQVEGEPEKGIWNMSRIWWGKGRAPRAEELWRCITARTRTPYCFNPANLFSWNGL